MPPVIKPNPPQPHFPWKLIAAFLIGLIAGYALSEWKHSHDQRGFSISIPSEQR